MEILFQNRNPQLWGGGDMIKMRRFQKYIRDEGHNVEFFYDSQMDISRFDVVHLFNINFPWTIEQAKNAQRHSKPFVVSAIYFPGVGSHDDMRWIIENAAAIIVFSDKETDIMQKDIGFSDDYLDKFISIPNGVDEFFESQNVDRDIDFLQVGTIHPRKNQIFSVDLASVFKKKIVIIGAAHDARYYEMVQQSGDKEKEIIQHISHNELKEYYARAKIVLQPSHVDPFPNTVLEAAIAGCHVIVTNNTYIPDNFTGIHQIPVTMNEWHSVVEKIQSSSLPNKRAQKYVKKNHNWRRQALKTIELYESVI